MKAPTTFTVEGKYPFPVDMLRYDACWPKTSDDATQLAEAMRYVPRRTNLDKVRQVKLVTNAAERPTVGRWESFGWKVV